MAGVQQHLPLENDLFRFVSVRGVNLPETGAKERRFAFSGLPDSYADFDAQYPAQPLPSPMLLVELSKLRDAKGRDASMSASDPRAGPVIRWLQAGPSLLVAGAAPRFRSAEVRALASTHGQAGEGP